MQAKTKERLLAVSLRKQGLSYSEIQQTVRVSQASLSLWLASIPLTKEQQDRLAQLSLVGQKAGAAARRKQRLQKLRRLSNEIERELPKLIKNPFFVLGVVLYAAEGSKQKPWNMYEKVAFCNSDATLILIMRKWFKTFAMCSDKDFIYRLHIHETSDVNKARHTWANILNVSPEEFAVTLKRNKSKFRHNQLNDYKGLVQLKVRRSTWLNRQLDLWMKGVAREFLQ